MRSKTLSKTSLLAACALLPSGVWALDPLLDEEEEPSVTWSVTQDGAYTQSDVPAWTADTWVGAEREFILPLGLLGASGSLGYLTEDFRFDSGAVQPKLQVSWSRGAASASLAGWELWDRSWTDQGAQLNLGWAVDGSNAAWKWGGQAWASQNSGSGAGFLVTRSTDGPRWATEVSVAARRLWDVDLAFQAPGANARSTSNQAVGDQYQILFQTELDRKWQNLAAGINLDLDLRATEGTTTSTGRGRGSGAMSSSSLRYEGSIDPYATLAWTPGPWTLSGYLGCATDLQLTKGSLAPVANLWSRVIVGWSY